MLGRDGELAVGRRFVESLQIGPGCLVLEGEAGIGKTTLWRALAGLAVERHPTLLAARPAAAEASLSFAGLADLLGGLDDTILAQLPAPQRHGLEVALLRAPASGAPERRSILAALSTLLGLLAEERPVVVAVDDLQWLDAPSQAALEFALRRVGKHRIGFLVTVRIADGRRLGAGLERALTEAGAQRLRLGPLSVAAIHDLIEDRLSATFARPVLVKVQAAARGNPFYALEIAREIVRRGEPSAGATLPVPDDLFGLVATRIRRLPAATRSALLEASALSRPDVGDVDRSALEAAAREGLILVEEEHISFTHPLFAAAVYRSAAPDERRALHRRLAERLADVEERARHLALAAEGPNDDVADALDLAAAQARSRGAPETAAELLEMAIRLTSPSRGDVRDRRSLAAAQDSFHAGDLLCARIAAEGIVERLTAGPMRGKALRLLGEIRHHGEGFAEAIPLLEAALPELIEVEDLAAVHVNLAYAQVMLGQVPAAQPQTRAALELVRTDGDDGWLAVALAASAVVDFYLDEPLDRARLEQALALEDPDRQLVMPMRPTMIAAIAFNLAEDLGRAAALLRGLRQRTIERGEESDLPLVDAHLAMVERRAGRLAAALEIADEGVRIARMIESATGRALVLGERAYIRATSGDIDGARQDAAAAGEVWGSTAGGLGPLWLAWAMAYTELSAGDPAATSILLEPLAVVVEANGRTDTVTATYLPDFIEALVLLGELDRASVLATMIEATGRLHDRPSMLAAAARNHALIAATHGDLAVAGAVAAEAVVAANRAGMPLERGRSLLLAGQIARRSRRKRAARAACQEALAVFEQMGALRWADRARSELARTGLRQTDAPHLTPTERQVAELAASGLTNRLIAERAFLSPKTVEANLARIYAKLGIGSRAELGRAMAGNAGTTVHRLPTK